MTSAELRTHSVYQTLSSTEKRVADYFLNNVEDAIHLSIAQLAQKSGVSQVAWVRFCKAIGFGGVKELRKALFSDYSSEAGAGAEERRMFSDLKDHATVAEMAETVKRSSVQAIEDTIHLLDLSAAAAAADRIVSADSVGLFGVGASALVAEDLFEKLLRIGKNVRFCRDLHVQLTYAANLTERDAAIFISNSGATREVLESLKLARQSRCCTVAITKFSKNPLGSGVDVVLSTSSPEVHLRSGAMSSRIAQLAVVDILFTAIASQDYSAVEARLERSYESCRPHKVK